MRKSRKVWYVIVKDLCAITYPKTFKGAIRALKRAPKGSVMERHFWVKGKAFIQDYTLRNNASKTN